MNVLRGHPTKQRGAILVVSLILLLIMTILAVTISQTSRMQEMMTGNARDADLSFQSAEAGLRNSEDYLAGLTASPVSCSSDPCKVFQENVLPADLHAQSVSFWSAHATEYGAAGTQEIPGVTQDPQYIIEEAGFVPDSLTVGRGVPPGRTFYRNTAHSFGGTDTAQTVVQSTFTRRY